MITTKQHGFTMIELLVAATILAVLATIGVVSFRSAAIRARDGKRQADLSQVRSGLELWRSAPGNTRYPNTNYEGVLTSLGAGSYLSEPYPRDPKNDATYFYQYAATNAQAGYCLCARLESGGGNSSTSSCSFGTGNFYCLRNP
ncbi:type II secretion system protein [Candidatus Woesebacteria bacterium]|nr:type II secretion system protein [Candidatus Woesebacteria bacterium]